MELVREASSRCELSQVKMEIALEAMLETIVDTVATGEKVKIVGFGSFENALRKPKVARNVYTNEAVYLPERPTPVFKPGKFFKDVVRGV